MKDLGTHILELRTVLHNDKHFNCKLVSPDLEKVLQREGISLKGVETREFGRGSPVAIRVRTDHLPKLNLRVEVDICITNHEDAHFNAKIVFNGLEEVLGKNGVVLAACETRAAGEPSPIAVQVRL